MQPKIEHWLIFDSTLRDGEQQPMLSFRDDEKIGWCYLMEEVGIFEIDLMPSIDEHERTLIKLLNDTRLRDRIGVATMMHRKYVDQAVEVDGRVAFTFVHTSDALVAARGKTREGLLAEISDCVGYASEKGLVVDFCAGDGTRSDMGYLREILSEIGADIRYFQLCDTAGILTPETSAEQVETLDGVLPGRIVVHYHNDLGLATENVIAALQAGAVGFDGTFMGVGERAGNVAIEKVLYKLRDEHNVVIAGINYDKVDESVMLLRKICRGIEPPKVDSGKRYPNVSGIHARALQGQRDAFGLDYEPEVVESHLFFGKHSGVSNYKLLFGDQFSDDEYARMRDEVKRLSRDQLRDFTATEIRSMYGAK